MTEQGYNYLHDTVSVQNMADFFESRCEEPEVKSKNSEEDSSEDENPKGRRL